MKIHNIMEDIVQKAVEDVFQEGGPSDEFCRCPQCRLDVICYVLNRLQPQYVVSGRGLAYFEIDSQKNIQRNIDLVMLVHEGIKKVSAVRRPGHDHKSNAADNEGLNGPVFNFPTIMGRVFNGKTFEPVSNIEVSLLSDGKPIKMINSNWQNPYQIVRNTSGNYLFWPAPQPAKEDKIKKDFRMLLHLFKEGFSEINHFFDLEITSSANGDYEVNLDYSHKIEDLYLFQEAE